MNEMGYIITGTMAKDGARKPAINLKRCDDLSSCGHETCHRHELKEEYSTKLVLTFDPADGSIHSNLSQYYPDMEELGKDIKKMADAEIAPKFDKVINTEGLQRFGGFSLRL